MATPSITSKPWKRIALVSLFGGVGITLSLAALLGLFFWYNSRPRPWNAQAIRAHYNRASCFVVLEDWYKTELKNGSAHRADSVKTDPPTGWTILLGKITVQFSYDLENSTNSDYTLDTPESLSLIPMQRLKLNRSLIDGKGLRWSVAEPLNHLWVSDGKTILIPAHQTVRISFSHEYDLDDDDSMAANVTDWSSEEVRKDVARHLLKDTDAFILLDEAHHYRIELPLQELH
jgi:hypothetical protein